MMTSSRIGTVHLMLAAMVIVMAPAPALAYGGPGLGLGFLAVVFGAVSAAFLALVGHVWYPIKRRLARLRQPQNARPSEEIDQA